MTLAELEAVFDQVIAEYPDKIKQQYSTMRNRSVWYLLGAFLQQQPLFSPAATRRLIVKKLDN